MESRTQGSRPRPRTQKKSEAKAKDNLSEDRHSRGQGRECSRPRTKDTSASALQKKRSSQKFFRQSPKKRSSQKIFKRSLRKNVFQKNFQALHKILTIQKILLSSSRGQANFRGLEASRPRPRTSKCVLEDSTSGCYCFFVQLFNTAQFLYFFSITYLCIQQRCVWEHDHQYKKILEVGREWNQFHKWQDQVK